MTTADATRSGAGLLGYLAPVDEPTIAEETEALGASPRTGDHARDQRVILGNTGQNVLGLVIGAVATFAAQVIMTRRLGDEGFGVVTLTTQFAFIAAAATKFGMDVANVRLVAILVGRMQSGRSRGLVLRAGAIAAAVSIPFAIVVLVLAPWLADTFSGQPDVAEPAFRAAAVTTSVTGRSLLQVGHLGHVSSRNRTSRVKSDIEDDVELAGLGQGIALGFISPQQRAGRRLDTAGHQLPELVGHFRAVAEAPGLGLRRLRGAGRPAGQIRLPEGGDGLIIGFVHTLNFSLILGAKYSMAGAGNPVFSAKPGF